MAADESILAFRVRPARRRAGGVAAQEALSLLRDLRPELARGGPLSEQGGLFWIWLPTRFLDAASERLPRLGYSIAVDLVQPVSSRHPADTLRRHAEQVRWKGKTYELLRLYEEDALKMRATAPDRRVFLFETSPGQVRAVRGYRGDSRPLSRRGLPVCDARLLVNLVYRPGPGVLLDPFAGAGGVVIEALSAGWSAVSVDVDAALRCGLSSLGGHHIVADATRLPLATESVQAIATEPPYAREFAGKISATLDEMARVLQQDCAAAMLCAAWQAEYFRAGGARLGLQRLVDSPINRKGLDVVALAWVKA